MADITPIQNQAFAVIRMEGVPLENKFEYNSPVQLTCKDNQGNTIVRSTIEVDCSEDGTMEIYLPDSLSLNSSANAVINIIVVGEPNPLYNPTLRIYTTGSDLIDGTNVFLAPLVRTGLCYPITLIYEGFWNIETR